MAKKENFDSGKQKPIGSVTEEEKEQIEYLHERLNSLQELAIILENKPEKAEMLVAVKEDVQNARIEFETWWQETAKRYVWPMGCFKINFMTNQVFLEKMCAV